MVDGCQEWAGEGVLGCAGGGGNAWEGAGRDGSGRQRTGRCGPLPRGECPLLAGVALQARNGARVGRPASAVRVDLHVSSVLGIERQGQVAVDRLLIARRGVTTVDQQLFDSRPQLVRPERKSASRNYVTLTQPWYRCDPPHLGRKSIRRQGCFRAQCSHPGPIITSFDRSRCGRDLPFSRAVPPRPTKRRTDL